MTGPEANIHHFTSDPKKGEIFIDDDGEPLHGYYYEIKGADGVPLHDIVGPYNSAADAEQAAINAWRTKSYK